MNFEKALFELKCGEKICRSGWQPGEYWSIMFKPEPFLFTGLVGFKPEDILACDWKLYETLIR
jgi:hypothetical protein